MRANLRMTEADLLEAVHSLAKVLGWRVAHFRPAKTEKGWRTPFTGDIGFCDLVLARNGRVLLIELKSDKGKLGPGQQEWLDAYLAHLVEVRDRG